MLSSESEYSSVKAKPEADISLRKIEHFNLLLDYVSSTSESSSEDEEITVRPHRCNTKSLIEVNNIINKTNKPNSEEAKIKINSKLNYSKFQYRLRNYEDSEICKYIRYGWPIGHNRSSTSCNALKNHGGARNYPEHIDKYIKSELLLGRIIGPFHENPYRRKIAISPLNSLEKKDTNDRRVITDLSYPELNSVNSGINKNVYLDKSIQTTYPTVDNVTQLILNEGRNCMLYKRDMKKAFRQIQVDPADIHLLSFRWRDKIYSDVVLTMGLRSSAYICQRITNAISYMCRQDGYNMVNYLDDFCGVEKINKSAPAFDYLQKLLVELGVEEARKKASPPATRMAFLGIWFDTEKMTMEVTPERLIEIKELTQHWLKKRKATLKEVQSIIGKLNFVAKCVKPSRIFISRMLNFLRSMNKKGKTSLTTDFKGDVEWWNKYLQHFNGIRLISAEKWTAPDEIVASDACLTGCGATCDTQYFHTEFPEFIQKEHHHINTLELLALIVALNTWAELLHGKKVTVLCDNIATVWVINTGKTRD